MARAAVVYLRDWQQTGSASSRAAAFQMLRGLTYLQTVSGPNAGNVVLWMQPDGTLNPSAEPKELPDPSDSDASYWLARTAWALGEGYAAFRQADPAFAGFLGRRMDLAVAAIDRQVLDADGRYLQIDGRRTPAWLIADGADASAEAVLGLAAYVRPAATRRAPGARPAQRRHRPDVPAVTPARGPSAVSCPGRCPGRTGTPGPRRCRPPWPRPGTSWATGRSPGRRPSTRSRSTRGCSRRAARTTGGCPTRVDATQIAYGADSRVQSLLATGGAGARLAASSRRGSSVPTPRTPRPTTRPPA